MKEITVLSGKGGTGKTSITAALASVAHDCVFADNDVDAADMHLILDPQVEDSHVFIGAFTAEIKQDKCTSCGICADHCRFDAIHCSDDGQYTINPFQCEGCRLCERVCPENAIVSEASLNNYWYNSNTRFGHLIHATMKPGEENSGKLVAQVRRSVRLAAHNSNANYILNDGPPGIGCAAISSVTGADEVLLVTEPSLSGLHDTKRISELVRSFGIPMKAIINKSNLNNEIAKKLDHFFEEQHIPIIAKIPFDKAFVHAMIQGKTICEYSPNSELCHQIKHIWQEISKPKAS